MPRRSLAFALYLFAIVSAAFPLTAFQADDIVTETTILYDGRLESSPDRQGFSFLSFGPSSSQFYASGVTVLDTTVDSTDQAGYFNREPLTLDRRFGYTLQFSIQMGEEEHRSPHRAGFSVIILSDDLLGLELAFWENEIWTQEGGTADSLFKHAEGVPFDTTGDLTTYELTVLDDAYSLSTGGTTILGGPLRDYTAFDGFPDIYESPGLIFLGDNTRRGAAKTAVTYVALERNTLATATPQATETSMPSATPSMEPSPTASATSTPVPTQTVMPTQTTLPPTAVPTATTAPRPTAAPFPNAPYKLYLWTSCLKGVGADMQK